MAKQAIDAIRILPWLLLLVTLTWVLGSLWRMNVSVITIRSYQTRTDYALKKLARYQAGEDVNRDEPLIPEDLTEEPETPPPTPEPTPLPTYVTETPETEAPSEKQGKTGSKAPKKKPAVEGSDSDKAPAADSADDLKTTKSSKGAKSTDPPSKGGEKQSSKKATNKKKNPKLAILMVNADSVVNGRTIKVDWLYKMGFHNHAEYAKKWNYDLIVENEDDFRSMDRDISWAKVLMIQKWLPHYEWVMYMDSAAFFMRFDKSVDEFTDQSPYDAILTQDWRGPNTGVMLVKRSTYTTAMLKDWWEVPQRYWEPYQDMTALAFMLQAPQHAAAHEGHFHYADHRVLTSFPEDFARNHDEFRYHTGDFIAHLPFCPAYSSCRRLSLSVYGQSSTANHLKKVPATIPQRYNSQEEREKVE